MLDWVLGITTSDSHTGLFSKEMNNRESEFGISYEISHRFVPYIGVFTVKILYIELCSILMNNRDVCYYVLHMSDMED
jgi:heat shock protein HspQ